VGEPGEIQLWLRERQSQPSMHAQASPPSVAARRCASLRAECPPRCRRDLYNENILWSYHVIELRKAETEENRYILIILI
jgi:hypothetical protein